MRKITFWDSLKNSDIIEIAKKKISEDPLKKYS